MEKTVARKWILSFFTIVLIAMLLLSMIAYTIDPFFQFRVKDNSYLLSGWFVSSGLIENYDYDTLIIGSSMMQNFDMDLFRQELGVKPLHVGLGSIRPTEVNQLINIAYEADKCKNYYVCVDLSTFTNDGESRYPEHLIKKDILSRLRYLLSYEVWFRHIPVDVSFMLLDRIGVNLPVKFVYGRSIDKLEDWRLDYPVVGKDAVIENYLKNEYSVSEVDTENLYERMVAHIDKYLAQFDFSKGKHIFFFPPYSSLYWCNAQKSDYFDTYLYAKQYFVEKATACDADVYDFQCADFTSDLNNYKDTTHYLPQINDWMVKCFANGDYLATAENYHSFQEKLIENTSRFRNEYAYLFY